MTFKKTLKRKEVKNKDKTHKSLFLASVYPIFEMRQSHSWDSASPGFCLFGFVFQDHCLLSPAVAELIGGRGLLQLFGGPAFIERFICFGCRFGVLVDQELCFQRIPLRVELRREFVAEECAAEELGVTPVCFCGRVVFCGNGGGR